MTTNDLPGAPPRPRNAAGTVSLFLEDGDRIRFYNYSTLYPICATVFDADGPVGSLFFTLDAAVGMLGGLEAAVRSAREVE